MKYLFLILTVAEATLLIKRVPWSGWTLGWHVLIVVILVMSIIVRYFWLPGFLKSLAEQRRFIDFAPEEMHVRFYTLSNKLHFWVRSEGGKLMFSENYTHNWLSRILASLGMVWLGPSSPDLIDRYSFSLPNAAHKVRSIEDMEAARGALTYKNIVVDALRTLFDMWVLVVGVEMQDGKYTTWLVRATIKVANEHEFVFGRSIIAYEAVRTKIMSRVASIIARHSLIDLLFDQSVSEITSRSGEGGKRKDPLGSIRVDLAEPEDHTDELGVEISRIDVDSWAHNGDAAFLKLIGGRKEAALHSQEVLEKLENEAAQALERVKTLKAQGKEAEAEKEYNEKMLAAVKAACGEDAKVLQHALLLRELGPQAFALLMLKEGTQSATQLVLGGGGNDILAAAMQAFRQTPNPQTPSTPNS